MKFHFFLPTLALAAPLGQRRTQTTCLDDNDCTRNEFCGTDGTCYAWSCEHWFEFGTWTNRGNAAAASLTCEEYSTGAQDNYHAVIFGCQGYGPGTEIPEGQGYSQPYNIKCSAELDVQTFECYHLAADTDFSAFVSLAESAAPKACDYTAEQVEQGSPTVQDYSSPHVYGLHIHLDRPS